jgi:hypothetical protein
MSHSKIVVLVIFLTGFTNSIQTKNINNESIKTSEHNNKISKEKIEQKITKEDNSQKFIKIETYADIQTCYINRPDLEIKKDLFTLAEHNKPHHYNAPDMNQWAAENPRVRTCEIGTITINNISFPISASSPNSKDPFRKPLLGPR